MTGILLFLLLLFIIISFILPFLKFGAGYAPTATEVVDRIVRLSAIKSGEKALDIGSGDGRIVIGLAKAGAQAMGYEINPILVWYSNYKIRKAKLEKTAYVYRENFWKQDFSQFDIVVIFGITYIMPKLEQKLLKELKPGARVITNYFTFPNWKPSRTEKQVNVYVKK
jgi:ribosomal protein L11 methylase PrmA